MTLAGWFYTFGVGGCVTDSTDIALAECAAEMAAQRVQQLRSRAQRHAAARNMAPQEMHGDLAHATSATAISPALTRATARATKRPLVPMTDNLTCRWLRRRCSPSIAPELV